MKAADFNILDIEVRERIDYTPSELSVKMSGEDTEITAGEFIEQRVAEMYCTHQGVDGDTFVLNFSEESAGTKIFCD